MNDPKKPDGSEPDSNYTNQDPDLKKPPKRYYPDWTMYAEQMLDDAGCPVVAGDITALTDDLSRRSNDFDGCMKSASEDLTVEIGGLQNLRAYVTGLKSGLKESEKVRRDSALLMRRRAYQEALKALESLIYATPTGAVRNELTDANMILMKCKDRQDQLDRHG
jgi:hypothetical protein